MHHKTYCVKLAYSARCVKVTQREQTEELRLLLLQLVTEIIASAGKVRLLQPAG